jgi:hypothetical protein
MLGRDHDDERGLASGCYVKKLLVLKASVRVLYKMLYFQEPLQAPSIEVPPLSLG